MDYQAARKSVISTIMLTQVLCALVAIYLLFRGINDGKILQSFVFSALMGVMGASIWMTRALSQDSENTVELWGSSRRERLFPLLYGAILACLLYILFFSKIITGQSGNGLLSSNLFPDFVAGNWVNDDPLDVRNIFAMRPASISDFGKLLVWSFIAGYSENFVIRFIESLKSQVSEQNKKSQD